MISKEDNKFTFGLLSDKTAYREHVKSISYAQCVEAISEAFPDWQKSDILVSLEHFPAYDRIADLPPIAKRDKKKITVADFQ